MNGDPCYHCGTLSSYDREACYWYCPKCGVGVDQDGQQILVNGTIGFPDDPPPFPFIPADPAVCTCIDPFSNCPTHG